MKERAVETNLTFHLYLGDIEKLKKWLSEGGRKVYSVHKTNGRNKPAVVTLTNGETLLIRYGQTLCYARTDDFYVAESPKVAVKRKR